MDYRTAGFAVGYIAADLKKWADATRASSMRTGENGSAGGAWSLELLAQFLEDDGPMGAAAAFRRWLNVGGVR